MRSKPPRNDHAPFRGKPSGKPAGKFAGKPTGKPQGNWGKPAGKPHGKPAGKPTGKPYGNWEKPTGKPHGKPYGKPAGNPPQRVHQNQQVHQKPHQGGAKPRSPSDFQGEQRRKPTRFKEKDGKNVGEGWIYGLHAVQAALANPRRRLGTAVLTARAAELIGPELLSRVQVESADMDAISRILPPGAVHQGAALEAQPLKTMDLDEALEQAPAGKRRVVLVLDQLSDPHNVGAILRTAAAFDVTAVIVQDRNAPPQSGALAKAASGALELLPYIEVVNIARALDQLAERGFWRIALANDGAGPLTSVIPDGDVALVLGSEGDGIRRLVRERCETAAFIPIAGKMESLNVSNAAAIALYELRRGTSV